MRKKTLQAIVWRAMPMNDRECPHETLQGDQNHRLSLVISREDQQKRLIWLEFERVW